MQPASCQVSAPVSPCSKGGECDNTATGRGDMLAALGLGTGAVKRMERKEPGKGKFPNFSFSFN